MKRVTVITPANGVWTLAKQPFHRCLLLASFQGLPSTAGTNPTIRGEIGDVSGNVIWQGTREFLLQPANIVFSNQGCETIPSVGTPYQNYGCPLPDDLTIPANYTLVWTYLDWDGANALPNLVLTTDDPFLDGARPFDDLQAP
jgi:hypothetical protein